jgi:uncharacterized phage-like protein YoqJ
VIFPTVSFTGHRSLSADQWIYVQEQLNSAIPKLHREHETTCFISGAALGVDLLAAELVVKFRDAGLPIKLVLYVPYWNHTDRWSPEEVHRFKKLLDQADLVSYYRRGCLYDYKEVRGVLLGRNRQLASRGDLLLAVWERYRSGGTHYTIERALNMNKPIICIDPKTRQRFWLTDWREEFCIIPAKNT